jgi:hypothetical protein
VNNLLKFASVLDKLRINAFDVFNEQVILWELPLAVLRAVFLHRCRAGRIGVERLARLFETTPRALIHPNPMIQVKNEMNSILGI